MHPTNIVLLNDQITELGAQLRKVNNTFWFTKRGISLSDEEEFYLLNKVPGAEKNHWNILCNGTIFSRQGLLYSLPPVKLYDIKHEHRQLPVIDYADCDFVQKISGHMICLCYPWNNLYPWYHSSTGVSLDKTDVSGILLKAKAKIEKEIDLDYISRIAVAKRTLTFQYNDGELFLVHGRLLRGYYEEYSEDELDILASSINAHRPTRIPCVNYTTALDLLKRYKDDLWILRDRKTGLRALASPPDNPRLKPKLIAKAAKIGVFEWKRLVPYWLADEHKQIIRKHPETEQKFAVLESKVNQQIDQLLFWAKKWSVLNLPAEGLAESIKLSNVPRWAVRIIISLCKVDQGGWRKTAVEEIRKITAKTFIKAMELS